MQIKFYKNLKRYVDLFIGFLQKTKFLTQPLASYQGLHCLLRIKREVHNKLDVETCDTVALSLLVAVTFVICL